MNKVLPRAVALLLAAATAVPAFAQAAPPPPGGPGDGRPKPGWVGGHDMGGPGRAGGTLSGLTPEGRKTLGDAMRDTRRGDNDALDTARDRVLQLLEADRLDVAALRRAMADEHRLGEAQQQRRQDAMLAAFQKLSPRDRQAFAVSMRNEHFQMQQRRKDRDDRIARMRERWGNRGDANTPPPPPAQR